MRKIAGLLAVFAACFTGLRAEETPAAPAKVIRVACVGDSITYGAGAAKGNSYPDQLGKLLGGGYLVMNFGHSGRTGLKKGMENNRDPRGYQLSPLYAQSLDSQPDIVILMFGTNDSKPVNWKELSGEFAADMESRIAEYRVLPSKPVVIIGLPAWVKKDSFGIVGKTVTEEIVPQVRALAEKTHCPCVDIYSLTKEKEKIAFSADGVHPCKAGYAIIAEAFAQEVRKQAAARASQPAAPENPAAPAAETERKAE